MSNDKKSERKENDEKNWLEWLVFSVSLLLLLGILGYLVYQVFNYNPTDPEITAEAKHDPSGNVPNRYQVFVYNKGGTTAEEVIVEFILYKAGKEHEKSELMMAFSPKDSKNEGWVTFSGNPEKTDSVVARVISYKKP
jgi:uncharacterized protein (TIGR02588 family)